jgi:hypothetical protein
MATIAESPHAHPRGIAVLLFLRRVWKYLWPPPGELAPARVAQVAELTLIDRIRKFLWLSSGLFSAASFAIPAIGILAYGSAEGMATDFLAAIVSAGLFGLACLMHFGPDEA